MVRSTALPPADDPDTAQPHQFRFGGLATVDLDPYGAYTGPSGRALSTAHDMALYAQAQLRSGQSMWQQAVPTGGNPGQRYGLGWYLETQPISFVHHSGGTEGSGAFLGVVKILLHQEPRPVRLTADPYRVASWLMLGATLAGLALWVWLAWSIPSLTSTSIWLLWVRSTLLPLAVIASGWALLRLCHANGLPGGAGIRGWPVDLVVGAGVLLSGVTGWVVASLLALLLRRP